MPLKARIIVKYLSSFILKDGRSETPEACQNPRFTAQTIVSVSEYPKISLKF